MADVTADSVEDHRLAVVPEGKLLSLILGGPEVHMFGFPWSTHVR